jgi:glycerol-3-phosphate dehydrogenase
MRIQNILAAIGLVAMSLLIVAGPAQSQDKHVPKATAWAEKTLRGWMSDPLVIEAIKAQNEKNAKLTQAEIDALDKQWRAETKAATKPLITATMGNKLSEFLKKKEAETKGLVTEIFVMDNKGLNVGQSDVTSDYWQGDEAKWQKTFLVGPTAIFVDKVEKDESTQKFQTQVSISVIDTASKAVIGAVTVGLDVETLLDM